MPAKIRAILKRSDEPIGHVTNISPTLKNLQNIVGGYIETVTFGDYVVICNEEGRLLGLPHNCTINGFSFVGDIAIVGVDGDDFGDCPMDLKKWKEILNA